MIFDLGWVHADPHLANFIYDKNKKQLVVLDHALYQQLS
jgi:predicted unusual protein kinase regulating ubiquinone biosynthesis (AarF/ABC1/UbiB family)